MLLVPVVSDEKQHFSYWKYYDKFYFHLPADNQDSYCLWQFLLLLLISDFVAADNF